MTYQLYKNLSQAKRLPKGNYVRVSSTTGQITISPEAARAFNPAYHDYVKLYYDPSQKLIKMKFVSKYEDFSCRLVMPSRTVSCTYLFKKLGIRKNVHQAIEIRDGSDLVFSYKNIL